MWYNSRSPPSSPFTQFRPNFCPPVFYRVNLLSFTPALCFSLVFQDTTAQWIQCNHLFFFGSLTFRLRFASWDSDLFDQALRDASTANDMSSDPEPFNSELPVGQDFATPVHLNGSAPAGIKSVPCSWHTHWYTLLQKYNCSPLTYILM